MLSVGGGQGGAKKERDKRESDTTTPTEEEEKTLSRRWSWGKDRKKKQGVCPWDGFCGIEPIRLYAK